ncbi:MAG TPA: hypothetical protein PLV00_03245 [Caldisericia bacterium]|jgi:hypothetical protein|nr:hypothetical protein [Caldisericia bacterium]
MNNRKKYVNFIINKLLPVILTLIVSLTVFLPSTVIALKSEDRGKKETIFDFQSIDRNIAIHNEKVIYPRKLKQKSSYEPVYQTWIMNVDGSKKQVLLPSSYARNIDFSENCIFYSPANPTSRSFSFGIRKTNLDTQKTSWILNEAIGNFQISDQVLLCLQRNNGFYLQCNCKGKNPTVVCQSSSYKKLFQHNQYCFVFEETDYENNVSTNYTVGLLQPNSRKTKILVDAGYNFFADSNFLYYINIEDQILYRTDLETFQNQSLSTRTVTSFRMDERYIYFMNCEMGILRPEYHYYRADHNGENVTYICSLPDCQLPMGFNEKSYHIMGRFLFEIHDDGTMKKRMKIPYGGNVLLITEDSVYYSYALEPTGMNTDIGVLHLNS